MRIVATSDFHGRLPATPPCDLLVIAGDICPDFGRGAAVAGQLAWLNTTFRDWLVAQPAKAIVGIAGNHDFVFETMERQVEELCLPWIYLRDSLTKVHGLYVYGVPWVPNLSRWAFHLDDAGLDRAFDAVPDFADIVISHGPPLGYCDHTCARYGDMDVGCDATNRMLARVRPMLLFCGHIHEAFGDAVHPSGTFVYNVSYVNENYEAVHPPVEITLAQLSALALC